MTPQIKAFGLFVVVNAVVVAVFVLVAVSTRRQFRPNSQSINRMRGWLFGILTVGLTLAFAVMFPHMPYPTRNQKPDRVVYAVGMRFSWSLTDEPIKTSDEWRQATYAPPLEIPAGSLVEFRVTSFDVNHGFAVFSPSGRLLGQVQAMPGYVNRLRLRLTKPGAYWVFCLELCGMSHHLMRGEFEVIPKTPEVARKNQAIKEEDAEP